MTVIFGTNRGGTHCLNIDVEQGTFSEMKKINRIDSDSHCAMILET